MIRRFNTPYFRSKYNDAFAYPFRTYKTVMAIDIKGDYLV